MTLVKIEAAFGGTWYDDPDDLTWTDVTAWGEKTPDPRVSWQRGRASAMERTPQPGMLTVTLNGLDGAFIPENAASAFYPDVQPGLPIRLTVAGEPAFYGFMTDLDPDVSPGDGSNWSLITVTAVDGWARVMQAGPRLTYRDRVLIDWASGRGLGWITASGQLVEVARSTSVVSDTITAQLFDAFGFGWWQLESTGLLDWSQPCAAGVLAESGGGDSSGMALMNQPGGTLAYRADAGFNSDRYGGMWKPEYVASGSPTTLVQSAAASAGGNLPNNFVRQQASIGRPPEQLLPAAALVASGWTVSAGSLTDVDALALAWTARSDEFDPDTGDRTTVADGADRALVWTSPSINAKAVTVDTFPVTVGQAYAVHVGAAVGNRVRISIRWLDSSGDTISESSAALANSSATSPDVVQSRHSGSGQPVAPADAVAGRLVLVAQTTSTIEMHSPGVYPAVPSTLTQGESSEQVWWSPARWWPRGASDHLWLWVQVPLTDPSAIGVTDPDGHRLWLHAMVQVDDWVDGELHSLAWNVHPGVDGVPRIWVDGVSAAAAWRLTYPGRDVGWSQGSTAIAMAHQWSTGRGTGSRNEASTPVAVNPVQPSAISTGLAIVGSDRWNASPDDRLVTRWHKPYGAPTTVDVHSTVSDTTDVLIGSLLDGLAWPASQRALQTGAISSSVAWTDGSDLGDYGSKISDLASIEYGWAGVNASGELVWLPLRWYDPGTGTAVAKAHLTYKRGVTGRWAYTPGLGQSMSEDKVVNQVNVSGGGETLTALKEDYDSQTRLGIRRQELSNTAWGQDAVDDIADEVLALYGRPTLIPDTVTLQATSADDPMLAVILALNPADVVLVDIPRAPADDLTVSALVGQISLTSDGRTLTAVLTLGPCPVDAVDPS